MQPAHAGRSLSSCTTYVSHSPDHARLATPCRAKLVEVLGAESAAEIFAAPASSLLQPPTEPATPAPQGTQPQANISSQAAAAHAPSPEPQPSVAVLPEASEPDAVPLKIQLALRSAASSQHRRHSLFAGSADDDSAEPSPKAAVQHGAAPAAASQGGNARAPGPAQTALILANQPIARRVVRPLPAAAEEAATAAVDAAATAAAVPAGHLVRQPAKRDSLNGPLLVLEAAPAEDRQAQRRRCGNIVPLAVSFLYSTHPMVIAPWAAY